MEIWVFFSYPLALTQNINNSKKQQTNPTHILIFHNSVKKIHKTNHTQIQNPNTYVKIKRETQG
jgi:hypothetical protein